MKKKFADVIFLDEPPLYKIIHVSKLTIITRYHMTHSRLNKTLTSLFLLMISFMTNANVLLWDFKPLSSGEVGYKFDAVFDDGTKADCSTGTIEVGITQENAQTQEFLTSELISCSGIITSKKLAEKYIEMTGGMNVWHSVYSPHAMLWTNVCVMYEVRNTSMGGYLGCTGVGASDVSCSVDSNNILFEHQSLSNSQLEGNTVTKTISLDCTGDTDALIYAGPTINSYSGSIALNSDGTLNSKISINGNQATKNGVKVKINSGKNSLLVSSTLHSNGKSISSGSYTGSGVLVIEPQ